MHYNNTQQHKVYIIWVSNGSSRHLRRVCAVIPGSCVSQTPTTSLSSLLCHPMRDSAFQTKPPDLWLDDDMLAATDVHSLTCLMFACMHAQLPSVVTKRLRAVLLSIQIDLQ